MRIFQSFNETFFYKNENENFCKNVLLEVLNFTKWRKGNADIREPDLIFNDFIPFEITLISDYRKQKNLIQRLNPKASKCPFESSDIIAEISHGLFESIKQKQEKVYCFEKVNLCLISPLPIDSWTNEELLNLTWFFNVNALIPLENVKNQFLHKGNIENIYVLVPTLDAKWCLIDLNNDIRYFYQGDINNPKYPYFIIIDEEDRGLLNEQPTEN